MNEDKRFYVYVHRRKSDGKVFYVGKGCGNRSGSRHGRSRHWHSVDKKHGFTHHVIYRFNNEECAYTMEKAVIDFYGIDNLVNCLPGGGVSLSDIDRIKRSRMCKDRKWSDDVRKKQSISKIGPLNHNYGKPVKPHVMDAMLAKVKKKVINRTTGQVFDSAADAARWVQDEHNRPTANRTMITSCCKGHCEMSYGYIWEYA